MKRFNWIAIVAVFILSTSAGAADWPQWRGAARDGKTPDGPALAEKWPNGPEKVWESEPIPCERKGGFSSVVVAGNRAFVYVCWLVQKKKANDVIVCLDTQDGKTVWKKQYPGKKQNWGSSGTPCVVGEHCYAVGSKGDVYCLNVKDGSEVWKTPLGGGAICSSPLVVDDIVVVVTNALVALDAKSGKKLWKAKKISDPMGYNPSPVIWNFEGKKYVIANCYCADLKSGEIAFDFNWKGWCTPVISGDTLVLNTFDKHTGVAAFKLSPKGAKQIWNVGNVRDRASSPLVHEGRVYATCGKDGLMCIDLASGKKIYLKKSGTVEISSPIWADGKIFGLSKDGIAALKPNGNDCKNLGFLKVDVNRCTSPAIVDGRLYLRGKKSVVCYDLKK
jgi:outer membrane protein assembly factor BamB